MLGEFFCRDLSDIGETGAGRHFGVDNMLSNMYGYGGEDNTEFK